MNDEQTAAIAEKFLERLDAIGAHALDGGQWAFEQLVQLYVMYGYRAIMWSVFQWVAVIVLVVVILKVIAYFHKEFDDRDAKIFATILTSILGGFAVLFFVAFAISSMADAIIYLNAPEAKVLQYLVQHIK